MCPTRGRYQIQLVIGAIIYLSCLWKRRFGHPQGVNASVATLRYGVGLTPPGLVFRRTESTTSIKVP
ncbi:hypothetical protein AB1N83_010500 [Pleurotus pulmonarius]